MAALIACSGFLWCCALAGVFYLKIVGGENTIAVRLRKHYQRRKIELLDGLHLANFCEAIRGKEKINAPILEGHTRFCSNSETLRTA